MPGGEASPSTGLTWTGWDAYPTHVPKHAAAIASAGRRLVDTKGVRRDLAAMMPTGAVGQPKPAVRMIVRSVVAGRASRGVLGRPLVAVYRAGWKAGTTAAKQAVADSTTVAKDDRPYGTASVASSVPHFHAPQGAPGGSGTATITTQVNWDAWTPGSPQQAAAAGSLEDLIRTAVGDDSGWQTRATARGSLLASIEDTRIDRLTDAVVQALVDGTSVDDLGGVLEGVLDDPAWADMVATTELARAMTAAAMDSYRTAGIGSVVYLAADDERECSLCAENEDLGEIPIGSDWPNGSPPVHPNCRCALAPGFGTSDAAFTAADDEG